jgi:group I intron endonuclease
MKHEIIYLPIGKLKPNPDNPRLIRDANFKRLVKSLKDCPDMNIDPVFIELGMLSKNISGIYAIFNSVDSRIYIGSAICVVKRVQTHKHDLRKNKHHSKHLQNFYNKYGDGSIGFALLCETEKTKDALIKTEQFFIDAMHPAFNISPTAGSNFGTVKTLAQRKALSDKRISMCIRYDDDYKRRMSIALSGKNNPMYGKSPNWGKKHNPETIKKMIESHHDVRGANNPKYGIPQSPEATAKLRITRSKRVFSSGRGVNVFRDGNLIGTYLSAMEASRDTGICSSSIYRVCNGKWRQSHGLQFAYTGGHDAIPQVDGN